MVRAPLELSENTGSSQLTGARRPFLRICGGGEIQLSTRGGSKSKIQVKCTRNFGIFK